MDERRSSRRTSRTYTREIEPSAGPALHTDAGKGSEPASFQLARALRVVRRRAWLIGLVTAVAALSALLLSLSAEPQYDATAKLLVVQDEPLEVVSGTSDNTDPDRRVNNVRELITLETLVDEQRRALAMNATTSSVMARLSTAVEANSDVVAVTFRDPDPRLAAAFVNRLALTFERFRRDTARNRLVEATRLATARLEALGPEERASDVGRQLQARASELETAAALQLGGVEVIRRSPVPSSPATPRTTLSVAAGLIGGLVIALMAAFLLELLDRRLNDESEVEAAFGLPVLAVVPRSNRREREGLSRDDAGQQEAFASLATNFQLASLGTQSPVALLTSGTSGEGKTSVLLGLARGLALLGQQVLVIEADLRRPDVQRYLRAESTPGLTSVLLGGGRLEDELITVDAQALAPRSADSTSPTFMVLPAGRRAPNPPRLLASDAMATVVAQARGLAEVVLIDTAPVGEVTDALTLLGLVDHTILVARRGRTTRDVARRALRAVSNAAAEPLGVVLTDGPPAAGPYFDSAPATNGGKVLGRAGRRGSASRG